jgi:hypothetical protein
MTTTTPAAATVSSSTNAPRHRKKGLPSVGLRAAVRGTTATTARHAAFAALAVNAHLATAPATEETA